MSTQRKIGKLFSSTLDYCIAQLWFKISTRKKNKKTEGKWWTTKKKYFMVLLNCFLRVTEEGEWRELCERWKQTVVTFHVSAELSCSRLLHSFAFIPFCLVDRLQIIIAKCTSFSIKCMRKYMRAYIPYFYSFFLVMLWFSFSGWQKQ